MEKIEIDLGFAKLIVEKGDPLFREVCVGLLTKKGDYQDLVVVGQETTTRNSETVYTDNVNIYVYGDSEQEDFTDKFTVGLADEFKDGYSRTMFVCMLPQEKQDEIKEAVRKELLNCDYLEDKQDFIDCVNSAMTGRICDLEDIIDLAKLGL